jgi:hypothetical protein
MKNSKPLSNLTPAFSPKLTSIVVIKSPLEVTPPLSISHRKLNTGVIILKTD